MIASFFRTLQTNTFPLLLAGFYLGAKLTIKYLLRRQARVLCDPAEILAWCGVDLSILCLGFSIGANLPSKYKFTDQGATAWYVLMVGCMLVTMLAYGAFLRTTNRNGRRLRVGRIGISVSVSLFFGVSPLLATASVIR